MGNTALEAFKRDLENQEKAVSRLTATAPYDGGTEPAALTWLLNFVSSPDRELARLNDWQRDEAFWEAWRFAWDGGQGLLSDVGRRFGAVNLSYPVTADERTALTVEIQRHARLAINDFIATGVGTFPKAEAAFSVMREGSLPLGYRGGTLAASFYYMAAQLLARYRHRVKHCEGCERVMLTGRKDQRFHSQSCQIGAFIRQKRAKEKTARATEAQRKRKGMKTATTKGRGPHGTHR